MTPLEFTIPLKVNANARGHARFGPRIRVAGKNVSHRKVTALLLGRKLRGLLETEPGGLLITLTRGAPSPLDAHDNIRTATKPIADGVVDALGLQSDRNPLLTFAYAQRHIGVRTYAVLIRIESRPTPCVTCGMYPTGPRINA